jgi:replication-associated recombination protein RarA
MPQRELPPTRRGYQPHEVVSALQKAVRRSKPEEAAYWAIELFASGYHNWLFKRLYEIAFEDTTLPRVPGALADLAVIETRAMKQHPKAGGMEVVAAAVMLATAPKSNINSRLVMTLVSDNAERLEVPDEALDRHTRAGRGMGRGWDHFREEAGQLIEPDAAAGQIGFSCMAEQLDAIEHKHDELFYDRINRKPGMPDNKWAPRARGAGTRDEDDVQVRQLDGPTQMRMDDE